MRAAPIVLAVLLLLAGCSAAPAVEREDPATTTVTPVDVPADYDYAPGLTTAGVTEPATLAEAHTTVLAGTAYRLTADRTVRYANGTLREQLRLDVALSADRTYLATAATRGPTAPVFLGRPPANATYWSNGTVYVRKLTRDGRTAYNDFDVPSSGAGTWRYWTRTVPFGGEQATPRTFYTDVFASVPVTVDGETTTGDTTAYQVSGDDLASPGFRTEVTDIRDVQLVATVREDGLVSSLTLRYAGTVDGDSVRVTRTVRYRSVGSATAPRPPWFQKAVEG